MYLTLLSYSWVYIYTFIERIHSRAPRTCVQKAEVTRKNAWTNRLVTIQPWPELPVLHPLPCLSPVISLWVFRKRIWFLDEIWIWSCDVIKDWKLSLLLHSQGEGPIVAFIWVIKKYYSVEGGNLSLKKALWHNLDSKIMNCLYI